jgi:hypothetical protein
MGKSYNQKADVFAFGIIMWEILTRQIVFEEIRFQFQLEDEIKKGSRPPLPASLERKEKVVDEYVKLMQVFDSEQFEMRFNKCDMPYGFFSWDMYIFL